MHKGNLKAFLTKSSILFTDQLKQLRERLSSVVRCRISHETPATASQRKRSMSTPEQATVYAVTADAGPPIVPTLSLPGQHAQTEGLQVPYIPGSVSPPR